MVGDQLHYRIAQSLYNLLDCATNYGYDGITSNNIYFLYKDSDDNNYNDSLIKILVNFALANQNEIYKFGQHRYLKLLDLADNLVGELNEAGFRVGGIPSRQIVWR